MSINLFWIMALGLFAAILSIGVGTSAWNRRWLKAVHERKRIAKALSDVKVQMTSWIKVFPGVAYRCKPDASRTMIFVSDAVERITGYPASDFVNRVRSFAEIIHPEDQALTAIRVEQGLKKARCFEVEYRIQTVDGEIRWLLERGVGSGRCDSEFGCEWVDGVIMDITAQKRNEEGIKLQRGMLRSLFDAMPDLISYKDRKGVYLECNNAFAQSTGKPPDRIIGNTDYELFEKELADRFRENDLKMLSKMKPRKNLEWLTRSDGRTVLLETLKAPLTDAEGKVIGLVSMSRDVTLIKKMASQLKKAMSNEQ